MPKTPEFDGEIDLDLLRNEFTGSARESTEAPGPDEPICLISYEITAILLGDGPRSRPGFWKSYRRELAFNQKSDYRNYHVHLCRHQLTSLRMKLDHPVYFRNKKLVTERPLDPFTAEALGDGRFQ